MISSNYLFIDLTISCILWLLSTHEMASYELFLSKLTTSWCKLFLFEKILNNKPSSTKPRRSSWLRQWFWFRRWVNSRTFRTLWNWSICLNIKIIVNISIYLNIVQLFIYLIIKSMAETIMAKLVYRRTGLWPNRLENHMLIHMTYFGKLHNHTC